MFKPVTLKAAAAIVLLMLSPMVAATSQGQENSPGDKLLRTIPAEILFVVRVNNFDYTLNQIDQFLSGASPMPLGVSIMARMQLTGFLGDPALNNVKTAESFALFGLIMPGESAEAPAPAEIFVAGLVPITDFNQFVSGNQNCSQPDDNGISRITTTDMSGQTGTTLIADLDNYALLTTADNYDNLLSVIKSISVETTGLAGNLDADEAENAIKQPLWAYGNIQAVYKTFGPIIFMQLEQAGAMMKTLESTGQPPLPNAEKLMRLYAEMLETLMKQTKSLSLTVNPKPDMLTATGTISAMPGTNMADTLTAGTSPKQQDKLLGYLQDGAMMNFAYTINAPLLKTFNNTGLDILAAIAGQNMTAEDLAKLRKLTEDITDSLGSAAACSLGIDTQASRLTGRYVLEIRDIDKFNNIVGQAPGIWNEIFADFYRGLGMETSFTVKRAIDNYKDVSIDSARLVFESTDANSPQGQLINSLYGEGIDYRWAIVDGLCVCAIAGDANSVIREMIDLAKAGGPAQTPSEITQGLALIPSADKADFVGTYNLLRTMKMAFAMSPLPVSQLDIQTKSNLAFAAKVGNGRVSIEIALPKQHLTECVSATMAMQQMFAQQMESMPQQTPQQTGKQPPVTKLLPAKSITQPGPSAGKFIIEPAVDIGGVRFGMTAEQMKEILGPPDNTTGCAYQYFNGGFLIITASDNTVDTVICGVLYAPDSPLIKNSKYRTSKDIGMGSGKQDIISAYGQPSSTRQHLDGSNSVTLEYEHISAKFTLTDDKVVQMIFRSPR